MRKPLLPSLPPTVLNSMDLTSMSSSLVTDPDPVVPPPALLENLTPSSVETWVSVPKNGLLENSSSLLVKSRLLELPTIEKPRDPRVSAMLNLLTLHPPLRLLLNSMDLILMDVLSDLICLLEVPVEAVAAVAVVVASVEAEVAVASVEAEAAVASVEVAVAVIEEVVEALAVVVEATEVVAEVVVADVVDSIPTKTLTLVALYLSLEPRCPSETLTAAVLPIIIKRPKSLCKAIKFLRP
jgi:hypothetical protein